MIFKVFFLLFLFLKGTLSFAQGELINLPLTKNIGEGPFNKGFRATILDTSFLRNGIPPEINEYIVKYVDFDYPLLTEEMDKTVSNRVHFLIGFKSDSIIIIVDQNYNLNFLDDTIFKYPKIFETEPVLPHVNLKMKYEDKDFIYTFQPYPYTTNFKYNSKLEGIHYLMIKQYEYKSSGTFFNDSPLYLFSSRPDPFIKYEQSVKIAIVNKNYEYEYYSLGDSFIYGEYRYFLKKITTIGDTLSLIKTHIDSIQTGFNAGLTLEPIQVKNINGHYINFPGKTGYTLIDFWGTWCGPCIELTPDLKKIYIKYQKIIDIISIAYDDDSVKAKKYIRENQMTWNHIIESNATNGENLTNLFNVDTFPTFILTDSTGKIVIRGTGREILENITRILFVASKEP